MKVEEVIRKYHKIVPFPISPKKIEKAGFTVAAYLCQLADDLKQCEDKDEPRNKSLIDSINKATSELLDS